MCRPNSKRLYLLTRNTINVLVQIHADLDTLLNVNIPRTTNWPAPYSYLEWLCSTFRKVVFYKVGVDPFSCDALKIKNSYVENTFNGIFIAIAIHPLSQPYTITLSRIYTIRQLW